MDFYGVIALDEDSTGTIPVESPSLLGLMGIIPAVLFESWYQSLWAARNNPF